MRRTKEESELTRAAILNAAERVFCEQGFAGAAVRGIAQDSAGSLWRGSPLRLECTRGLREYQINGVSGVFG